MFRLLSVALLLAGANAFAPSLPAMKTVAPAASSTARFIILSDDETDAILKSANECAESECSVDDVSSLVSELKGQQKEMDSRLKKISAMISELEHLSAKEGRNKDDVKAFVKDMMRVFSHGDKGYATGFSGDIGSGPTTAYDALPPKKWAP